MKIGLVTFHRAENYGALLQCIALYTYIKNKGYDIEIIDYRSDAVESPYNIYPKVENNPIKYLSSSFFSFINKKKLEERKEEFNKVRRLLKHSESVNSETIENLDYDVYISGSDQLWNTEITHGFDNAYLLNFKTNGIKATYAMSIGNCNNPDYKKEFFINAVKNFDFISMREKDAVNFISEISERNDIDFVIDPTLLLSKDEWDKLIGNEKKHKIPERYILLYYVKYDKNLERMADAVSREYGIPVVYINSNPRRPILYKFRNKVFKMSFVGPLDFVSLIKNASCVVTNSFHGTAFSCIYNKDIFMLLPEGTGSRLESIANVFGIQNRIFKSYDVFLEKYKDCSIDYHFDKFDALKIKSEKYISRLLDKSR